MSFLTMDWMPHFLPMATLVVVAAFTPGPNNIMLAASGANFGFRRTIPHMAGITVGFNILLFIAAHGLDWLFGISPLIQQALRAASFAFILWLAWRIATSTSKAKAEGTSRPLNFIEAAGFQFINPKALTMVTAINTLFIDPGYAFAPQLATILASAVVITLGSVLLWAGFGVVIGRFIDTPLRLRVFNTVMAVLLVASMLPVFLDMLG